MQAMFVELGSSADVWRPHIVRGILGSYGIDAVVWHEQAVHIYAPGWGARAILVVHEDDVEDALEILRAAQEPPFEKPEISGVDTAPKLFPSLRATIEGAAIGFMTLVLIEVGIHFFTHISEQARSSGGPPLAHAFALPPLGTPLAGVVCGILGYVMMFPLRGIKRNGWLALAAYLWVRVFIWLLAFALALCVL